MKRTILVITGLFTLVACSEDVYHEIDKQNTTNVETTGNSSDTRSPYTNSSPGFVSPYDFVPMYGEPITYTVINNTPLTLEIIPYIGLAYYDGIDDGDYIIPQNPPPPMTPIIRPSQTIDLTQGNYPNIYKFGKEYLNLLGGALVSIPAYSGTTDYSNGFHCPVFTGNLFNVQSTGATPDELTLLSKAGKCYYMDIIVKNSFGAIVHTDRIKPVFHPVDMDTPLVNFDDWEFLGFITPFAEPFYTNTLGITPSAEISPGTILADPSAAKDYTNFSYLGTNHLLWFYSNGTEVILELL